MKRYDREHEGVPLEECESDDGEMVTYADHVAEVTAAVQRATYEHHRRLTQVRDELGNKAENWDALMACRMRTVGGAGLSQGDDGPYSYITMEFWTGHPDQTDQPWIQEHFGRFIAKAVRAFRIKQVFKGGRT
jgi:hypothetical protein